MSSQRGGEEGRRRQDRIPDSQQSFPLVCISYPQIWSEVSRITTAGQKNESELLPHPDRLCLLPWKRDSTGEIFRIFRNWILFFVLPLY